MTSVNIKLESQLSFRYFLLNSVQWPRQSLLAVSTSKIMSDKRGRDESGNSTPQTSGVSSKAVAELHKHAATEETHVVIPESADCIPLLKSTDSTPNAKKSRTELVEPTLSELQENIVTLITQHLDQKINNVNERIDNLLKVTSENKNNIEELAKHEN